MWLRVIQPQNARLSSRTAIVPLTLTSCAGNVPSCEGSHTPSDTVRQPTELSVAEREVPMLERLMRNSPLFRERPRSVQVVTGVVLPIVAGAIAGVLLGVSAAAYWAISLIAFAGGILGGFEHVDGWDGADRGLVGGALFGIS